MFCACVSLADFNPLRDIKTAEQGTIIQQYGDCVLAH